MSYRALAVRYRPKKLSDLVGQHSLVKTITNAIQHNRIHHAFLLTGTRGVGKTTTARIIALSVNCIGRDGLLNEPTANPCLECVNCKQIINGNHPDVIEIDAASRTGVDSMREIIESCMYPPVQARYKVYIIDEVHMLSKAAFNALLKTLEEPHGAIKFIFATTEVKKIPVTITSRCQKFFLKSMGKDELSNHLINIANNEGFEIENDASIALSSLAMGSVRDGLSLLDQCISSTNGKNIDYNTISELFGIPETTTIISLFRSIIEEDINSCMEILNNITLSRSIDVVFLINTILEMLSCAIKVSINRDGFLAKDEISSAVFELRDKINIGKTMRMWRIVIGSIQEIKLVEDSYLVLEIMVIKILHSMKIPLPIEILHELEKEALESLKN